LDRESLVVLKTSPTLHCYLSVRPSVRLSGFVKIKIRTRAAFMFDGNYSYRNCTMC